MRLGQVKVDTLKVDIIDHESDSLQQLEFLIIRSSIEETDDPWGSLLSLEIGIMSEHNSPILLKRNSLALEDVLRRWEKLEAINNTEKAEHTDASKREREEDSGVLKEMHEEERSPDAGLKQDCSSHCDIPW